MFHVKHRPPPGPREWDADGLYAYGLRLLALRARSERELRQRFQARGADASLIDAAVARLKDGGWIDDEAFARAWVESRRRASPRGDRLLQRELFAKGVARPVADAAISEDSSDELELARAAAAKKARTLSAEAEPVFVRRLTSFLLRRGFEWDTASTVVRELAGQRDASG
jgi:regulatory protein